MAPLNLLSFLRNPGKEVDNPYGNNDPGLAPGESMRVRARSVAASRRLCPCATSSRERGVAWTRGAARSFACAAVLRAAASAGLLQQMCIGNAACG
jgi:hypothetical protein